MLVGKLLIRREVTRLSGVFIQSRCLSQVAVEPELTGRTLDLRLPAHKPKQPTREPFVKNVCLGKFDNEFLTYPEAQTHDRHREFFEWLKPIEDYINENVDTREIDETSRVKNEIFEELQRLGVLRAPIDEAYGGLGLNNSELAKLVETVSAVPVLGTYLIKRALIINLIAKYGTERQKSNLLPKIANGETIPTLCFSETLTGSITDPLSGKALISDCRSFFTIDARKTWVFDATRANLFVLLVRNQTSDIYAKVDSMSAFLIPASTKGISVEKPNSMLGQRGIDLCTVNFDKVKITVDGQLGETVSESDLFISALGEGKLNVGAQAVGILRRFLNLLTTSVRESKNFNSKRDLEDSPQEVIGKIASTLYSMEAMIYMTAGMKDNFENQDCTLEKSLVECYCTNACTERILQGMTLLGTSGYLNNRPFEQIVRDSLALSTYDRSNIDTKIFAALLAIQHVGQNVGNDVKKLRNPLFHPIELVRFALKTQGNKKHYLEEYLHPSLRTPAMSLEHSVNKMKKCIETLLVRHGLTLMNRRMELKRLTDIMIEIYAMTAVVARASRSYCIGMRNSDHEVRVAMIFTYTTYEKVEMIIKELMEADLANGDLFLKDIANSIFDNKKYFASHPMERNF